METIQSDYAKKYKEGVLAELVCQLWWGFMPIYWHILRPISSEVIIFYRILTVALVCLIIALIKYPIKELIEPFKDKKVLLKYCIAGILITANWSIYIWAVNADYVIQTCIGYYIEPLMICLIGMIVFHERLSKYKGIALAIAACAVIMIIVYYHKVPGIALGLAGTFSIYAAIKKDLQKPPVISLLYETIFLAPFALIAVLYLEFTGIGAISMVGPEGSNEMYKFFLLWFCGACTALPLGLFAYAANRVNMFLLGLFGYLSTSIALVLGIFAFKEPFDFMQFIAFAIIWIGLIFFTIGEFKDYKELTADV